MNKVIVFAGTTEGREICSFLKKYEIASLACTATEYGKCRIEEGGALTVRSGRLTEEEMEQLFGEEQPEMVIDATHPYADLVSENIRSACEKAGKTYLRLLRPSLAADPSCVMVDTTEEAVSYLAGTEASGLYEARLGAEEMPGKEVHVFCAGYRADEFEELLQYADHIVFNSPSQLLRFGRRAKEAGKSVGLRINPECSTQEGHEIYDPCAPGSRMGTTRVQWEEAIVKNPELMELLDGVHFHTLCEQDSDDLETTLASVKKQFGDLITKVKWINFGGGHHITRPGYDIGRLEQCIRTAQEEWKVEVYLEPGEAWALNAGFLLTSVLDVLKNGDTQIAIVDASAACHMPDVLEMPYRPPLLGAADETTENEVTVRLGGPTCLSGDIIGDYKFNKLPEYGDLLLFGDMAIYTTCKNNTFNGMPLPDIWIRHTDRTMQQLTLFNYTDFKERLGSRE